MARKGPDSTIDGGTTLLEQDSTNGAPKATDTQVLPDPDTTPPQERLDLVYRSAAQSSAEQAFEFDPIAFGKLQMLVTSGTTDIKTLAGQIVGLIAGLPTLRAQVVFTGYVLANYQATNSGSLSVALTNEEREFLTPDELSAIERTILRVAKMGQRGANVLDRAKVVWDFVRAQQDPGKVLSLLYVLEGNLTLPLVDYTDLNVGLDIARKPDDALAREITAVTGGLGTPLQQAASAWALMQGLGKSEQVMFLEALIAGANQAGQIGKLQDRYAKILEQKEEQQTDGLPPIVKSFLSDVLGLDPDKVKIVAKGSATVSTEGGMKPLCPCGEDDCPANQALNAIDREMRGTGSPSPQGFFSRLFGGRNPLD